MMACQWHNHEFLAESMRESAVARTKRYRKAKLIVILHYVLYAGLEVPSKFLKTNLYFWSIFTCCHAALKLQGLYVC